MRRFLLTLSATLLLLAMATPVAAENITFVDPNVKAICIANWDTNGDGELSVAEAAAVSDFGTAFSGNTAITSFDELKYFTGLTALGVSTRSSLHDVPFWAHTSGWGLDAPKTTSATSAWVIGESTGQPYGDGSVKAFADLSEYEKLIITYSAGSPRVLLNRDVDDGQWNEDETQSHMIDNTKGGWSAKYFTTSGNTLTIDLKQLVADKGYAHLHAIKGANWENITVESMVVVEDLGEITADNVQGFYGCTSLTSVTIPNNVTSLGDYAFQGCNNLTTVTIRKMNPVAITEQSFTNRANATLYAPAGCKTVYEAADYWKEFKSIVETDEVVVSELVINSSLEGSDVSCFFSKVLSEGKRPSTIVEGAGFENSRGIVVNSPAGVENEWDNQFFVRLTESLPAGTKFTVSFDYKASMNVTVNTQSQNEPYQYIHSQCIGSPNFTTEWQHYEKECVVPAECDGSIHDGGFKNDFRSIAFNLAVDNTQDITFYFDNFSVKVLNSGASTNNVIDFASSYVKAICVANWDTDGDGELSKGEAATVTNLGTVFKGNTAITSFDELQYFTSLTSISYDAFNYCTGLTSITIPSSVTEIGDCAFYYCSKLTSIEIPNGVTTINSSTFYYCSGLTSVTIPSSVTEIGDYAFWGCSKLTSVEIPNGVTTIGYDAFASCSRLTSVTIPSSVTSLVGPTLIEGQASRALDSEALESAEEDSSTWNPFRSCNNLTSITVESGNTVYDSRENCNAIIRKSDNTLVTGCKNTIIPSSVTRIGCSAFDCCGLTSVNIPNSVTSIGYRAFYDCSGLTSVTIPSSVTEIGDEAFYYCNNLATVIVENPTPTTISSSTFWRKKETLIVPKGSKEAYQAADYWKDFKYIIESSTNHQPLLPYIISTKPAQGSFNIDPAIKQFTVKFDKVANAAKIEATLDGKALTVAPAEGLAQEIILNYTGDNLANGLHTIHITKVYPEDESLGEEVFTDSTYTFSVGVPDASDVPIELIPISYFNTCANGSVPEGFLLYADGMEERVPSGSYTGGARLFSDFADGGDFTSALYMRSNYLTYGLNDDDHRLTMEAGKTYTLSFNTARWKSSGQYLKVQILNLDGDPQFEQTVSCDPNVNGSKAAVTGSSAYSFGFTPVADGDYELRFVVANNAEGEDAGDSWHELLLANVKFGYIPSSNGVAELMAVNEALGTAQRIQRTYASERYNGTAQTALNDAIDQVLAEKDGFTSPSECNAAVELLANTSEALIEHANACNEYDRLIKIGADVVRQNAANKFNTLQLYAQLKSAVEKYHGISEVVNEGTEEEPNWQTLYTYDVLKNSTELNTALTELTDIVETTQNLFTITAEDAEISQEGTTGVAALVERLRLGAKALKVLDPENKVIDTALNALDDDDDIAEMLKDNIKAALRNKMKEGADALFGNDPDTGEPRSYDMTVFIKNPNMYSPAFSTAVPGWEALAGNPKAWSSWDSSINHSASTPYAEDGSIYLEWHQHCTVEQTIQDLPAGVYNIYFNVHDNSRESDGGTYVYAMTSDTPKLEEGIEPDKDVHYAGYVDISNSGWNHYINDIVVKDGVLTLGFTSGTVSQPFLNYVKLSLVSLIDDDVPLTDAIYIDDLNARVGATTTLDINLKNSENATAYVFDLVLPEGITVAKNDKDKYIDALSDRHVDHTRTFNYKGNNTYSLSTLSGNSEELAGNDGAIRILTLAIADNLPVGTYAVDIKNASYSTPTGKMVKLPDTAASITVEDYVLGDVNGNGGVDIGDAVSIVNYLVGKPSTTFVEKAADTNKNGGVDIGDAVTIVNVLVGKATSFSRTIGAEQDEKEPQ